jgi:hypothetical protein
MGQYFKIVNPIKRQHIDASRFGENVKASGIFYGYHTAAVAFLLCNIEQVRDEWERPIYEGVELAGSWCGDPVYVVGDDQGKADEFGIKTSSEQNPERNLYFMAHEEYEDISYKAIALICNVHEEIAADMVKRAVNGYSPDRDLVDLGNVVFTVGCEPLKRALMKEFGGEWESRYRKAYVEYPEVP